MVKGGGEMFKRMFIGGKWTEAVTGGVRSIFNPFNQEVIGEVPEGGREDAKRAIQAARQAFDKGSWPDTPAAERERSCSGWRRRYKGTNRNWPGWKR